MKQIIVRIRKQIFGLAVVAMGIIGCGGGDDGSITGPSEGGCYASTLCRELDPELCVQAGCELRREGDSAPTCAGEAPTTCEEKNEEQCAQVRGCAWTSYDAT